MLKAISAWLTREVLCCTASSTVPSAYLYKELEGKSMLNKPAKCESDSCAEDFLKYLLTVVLEC